jgi:hypothetical protein
MESIANEKKRLEEEELPKAKTAAEEQISLFKRAAAFDGIYSKTLAGKLIAPEDELKPAIKAKIDEAYDIGDKDGKLVLFKKGTTNIAYKEGTSTALTIEDALTESAKSFIKKQDPIKDPRRIKEDAKGEGQFNTIHQKRRNEAMEKVHGKAE